MPLFKTLLLAAACALANLSAHAQSALPMNLFGTVTEMRADTIGVKLEDGTNRAMTLAGTVQVFRLKPTTIADIRPNDFVASAAEPKADGTLHSTELRIFPEAMRGVGEGQRPMNDPRKQVMTNATVTGPASALGGDRVKVAYRGGEAILVIGKDVPVIRIEEAQTGDVKPGARVRLQGGADGVVSRITIQ